VTQRLITAYLDGAKHGDETDVSLFRPMDVLPGMNAGVSIFATLSPIEGSRVAEEDVGRLGIEPSAAKTYPSPA
jgi:hypothetical protein